jgi:oxalate decarboxylase/phosphoglucose isomerase-like protein (cupin superfamily)
MNEVPKDHKVLLDNDSVRVLEFRIRPGETSEMHWHPPNIVYSLGSARIIVKSPNQKSREVAMIQGEAIWSDGGSHEVINIGTTDNFGIVIELKQRH